MLSTSTVINYSRIRLYSHTAAIVFMTIKLPNGVKRIIKINTKKKNGQIYTSVP